HQPVHPHRAGAHLRPDAGGPEGERALEAVRERRGVPAVEQPTELGPRLRVRVGVPPGGGPGRKAAFRSRHRALPTLTTSAADRGSGPRKTPGRKSSPRTPGANPPRRPCALAVSSPPG